MGFVLSDGKMVKGDSRTIATGGLPIHLLGSTGDGQTSRSTDTG